MTGLHVLQTVAVLIVLAEALNKIERTDLFDGRRGWSRLAAATGLLRPWAWHRPRVVTVFKVAGWFCLAAGAFDSLLTPPARAHVAVLVGFALLIVRSRLKEFCA